MNLKRILRLQAVFLSLAFVSTALAGDENRERVEEFATYLERLDLTDAQSDQFKEALAWQREMRKEILESHGFEANAGRNKNFKALRKASGDLKRMRSEMNVRLSEFLTPVQMTEFQELQKELKGGFKKKLREMRKERSS